MMQIVYFSQKDQLLSELQSLEGEVTFVTPSPLKADGLRTGLSGFKNQDVITIAKFTSLLVEALWESEERPMVKRKAELLLMFGILKNKYFPTLDYEQFTQSYNLFSDLRSFTLDEQALSSVMEEWPIEIRKSVQLFWRLLEATGFLDEHGAYQKITEALRSIDEKDELDRTWVFWGFQHLNGQQVDLIKALAIRYKVVIPFPLALKDRVKKTDWINWLKDHKLLEIELERLPEVAKGNWLPTNSRENAKRLAELIEDKDQIILGVSKLSPSHIDFVPSSKVSYKIPHQLISAELSEVADEIKERFKDEGTLDLLPFIKSKVKPGEFKKLKVFQLYEEAIKSIQNLTDEKIQVDQFFLKLLHDVVSLNQPRTSFIPMCSTDLSIDLKDMSSLEDVDRKRRIILCIDERFDDIQGLGQNYPESVQKALASLGPIKRNELELLFKQWEFNDLFSRANVLVLMSEGTLKHSLVWKRLFSNIQLEKIEMESHLSSRVMEDHFKNIPKTNFEGRFSASKFQTFLDCRRKFYFSYVDKTFPTVALEKDFDPLISGTIIHKIIEEFYKRSIRIENLSALTIEIMEKCIQERKLDLPRETYLQKQLIFNHRARNGIQFLVQLEEVLGEKVHWKLEDEFDFTEDYRLTGKIDCLGESEKYVILLDFKSTKFSASSFKEVEDHESLQLWTYVKAASMKVPNIEKKTIVMGYVVLDRPSESNLLVSEDSLLSRLKETKFSKQKLLKEDFGILFEMAKEKMLSLAISINEEREFLASPRKTSVCNFCDLNKVCLKVGAEDV